CRALDLFDLDANAAGADRAMHAREPQLVLPAQVERFAKLHQLLAIVGAAAPDPAGPSSREVILRRQQEHPATSLQPARQLRQPHSWIGKMSQNVAASNPIE